MYFSICSKPKKDERGVIRLRPLKCDLKVPGLFVYVCVRVAEVSVNVLDENSQKCLCVLETRFT